MAWTVLSPSEISAQLRGTLRRYLPGTDALLWPNNLTPIVKTVAAAMHDMHLRGAWLYDQIFASTATVQHLERHAAELGLYRRPQSRATGQVVLTAVPDTIYPAGIRFLHGARLYTSVSDARSTIGGTLTVTIASDERGAVQDIEPAIEIERADPAQFVGLATTATVDADGISGGADLESDASLRARVLDRKRRPPQGGAYSDYEQIARAIPGVTKAWAYPFADQPGIVGVWFLFQDRANGVPTSGDVETVQAILDGRRLIRAGVVANAPIPAPVDVVIAGLVRDATATRAAIELSLRAMFADRARPGVASDPFTFSRSWVWEAVSKAAGEDRHILVSPPIDMTWSDGSMPVLGAISYV